MEFDVIVPGRYRWLAGPGAAGLTLRGEPLDDGATFALDTGVHAFTLLENADGVVALAVDDAAVPGGDTFYSRAALREFNPLNP
ncbi:hypothetical protein D3C83_113830 [compost metagenome]